MARDPPPASFRGTRDSARQSNSSKSTRFRYPALWHGADLGTRLHSVVTAVSCGASHCAAITDTGSLLTWGDAAHGKLGHGPGTTSVQTPTVRENVVACVRQIVLLRCADTVCIAPTVLCHTAGRGGACRLSYCDGSVRWAPHSSHRKWRWFVYVGAGVHRRAGAGHNQARDAAGRVGAASCGVHAKGTRVRRRLRRRPHRRLEPGWRRVRSNHADSSCACGGDVCGFCRT